jgi:hypothetical protein
MTMMYTAKDYDRALLCPESVFKRPMIVVATDCLTTSQKFEVLKRWEADARHLEIAAEESMFGGEDSLLGDVRAAIDLLCAWERLDERKPVRPA